MEKEIIYYRETNWESIIADNYTFAGFIGAMFINHFYLGGSGVWAVILFGMLLLTIIGRASMHRQRFGSKEELIKYLEMHE